MKLQMASMPRFPKTLKNNCPMGRGRVVVSRSDTDEVAKDAAMSNIHPRITVPVTPVMIAIGADLAAPTTSSLTCAAESSSKQSDLRSQNEGRLTTSQSPHW